MTSSARPSRAARSSRPERLIGLPRENARPYRRGSHADCTDEVCAFLLWAGGLLRRQEPLCNYDHRCLQTTR